MHPHIQTLLTCIDLEEKEQANRYKLDQTHTLRQLKAEGLALHPIIVTRRNFGYADYPEITFKLNFPPEANLFRDGAAIDALVTDIEQNYGPVLVLVNNAGITKDNLLLRMSEDDWDDILNIHLKAVYRLSKRVLKGMTKARFGRIINISSVVAHFANPGQANYSAAKAGIEAFSRSLAKEMGSRQITVNSVAPGFIATEMTEQLSEDIRKKMSDQVALNRLGDPQDIANAVSFLASDKANYITGTVMHVNGGLYMS